MDSFSNVTFSPDPPAVQYVPRPDNSRISDLYYDDTEINRFREDAMFAMQFPGLGEGDDDDDDDETDSAEQARPTMQNRRSASVRERRGDAEDERRPRRRSDAPPRERRGQMASQRRAQSERAVTTSRRTQRPTKSATIIMSSGQLPAHFLQQAS